MGLGKTYSTKYLLDSNNNRGAEGQVLSTTSTGIDWVDANTVPGAGLWLENGNDIYNSNSGNVGIGTDSPEDKLEVSGGSLKIKTVASATLAPSIKLGRSDQANGNFENHISSQTGSGASQCKIEFKVCDTTATGRTTLLSLDGGNNRSVFQGNVGIGTTNPGVQLEIGAANHGVVVARLTQTYEKVRLHNFDLLGYSDGHLWMIGNDSNTSIVLGASWDWDQQVEFNYTPGTSGVGAGLLTIGQTNKNNTNYTHGVTRFYTNGLERMRINSAGNVGIGTDANVYGNLHLEGGQQDIVLTNYTADGVANSTISRIIGQARGYSNDGAAMQSIDFVTNATAWYKGDIVFKTNNTDGTDTSVAATEKMRIASNGNVGIGFTSPDSTPLSTTKLSISGNTYVAGTLGIGATSPVSGLQISTNTTGDANRNTTTAGITLTRYISGTDYRGSSIFHAYQGISGSDKELLAFAVGPGNSNSPFDFAKTKMVITEAGNVGIGTTTPNAKLDIQGTQGQLFSVTDDLSGSIFAVADISGVPIFDVNSDGTSYFDGDVGIGTTSPGAKLHVDGTAIFDTQTGAQPFYITRDGATDQALKIYVDDSAAIFESIQDEAADNYGAFQFILDAGVTEPYFDVRKGTALANTLFRVDGNGNVGVGTTSPGSKLEVNGTFKATGTGLIQGRLSVGTSSSSDIDMLRAGGNYITATNASGVLYFRTVSDIRMAILANGNIGIKTTNPSYLLDVRDGTLSGAIARFSAVNAHVIIESSTAGPAVLHLKPNATGNKSGQFKVTTGEGYNFRWSNDAASTAEVTYMKLDTSTTGGGDLTVKGDIIAYGAPSDERYKENIKPIESALDKALKLQGVTFDWKESDSILDIKEDIGFIAQDVQKVIPELVRENEDGKLSLRYQGVTPILLEAIKELKAEIEELKKQIK